MDACDIRASVATNGGGVCAEGNVDVTLRGSVIEDCLATEDGGGAYLGINNIVVDSCSFIANTAGDEGGGLCSKSYSWDIRSSLFLNNTADDGGGANFRPRYPLPASGTVIESVFRGNEAPETGGGAHLCHTAVTGCLFEDNACSGGSTIRSVDCEIRGCTFVGNSAGSSDSVILLRGGSDSCAR